MSSFGDMMTKSAHDFIIALLGEFEYVSKMFQCEWLVISGY